MFSFACFCLAFSFQLCKEDAWCRVAGELAAEPQEGTTVPPGPGTARVKLIDALYSIGDTELERVKMKTELVDWD